jgi:RNA recognition motif-containing protein
MLCVVLLSAQVSELLSPFGAHTRFNLLMDSSGVSKGTAVCEYVEESSAVNAAKGLDNLSLAANRLMVQRYAHLCITLHMFTAVSTRCYAGDSSGVLHGLHSVIL